MMTNIKTTLAATLLLLGLGLGAPAFAGKGGSAGLLKQAIESGSTDAIIAEVEKVEGLMCETCVQMMTNLTEDSRYPVREVAGWWFAKRPALAEMLADQMKLELETGGSVAVRNAADFLGATRTYTALPKLRAAINRGGLDVDARLALVRSVGAMAHQGGNPVLVTAMADRDATVRSAAVRAWRDVLKQTDAAPAIALLGDPDADVRGQAATVVGAMTGLGGRAQLERLVVADSDPVVRRNAAWALGKLGQGASRAALAQAVTDPSGLVRMTAKVALGQLR